MMVRLSRILPAALLAALAFAAPAAAVPRPGLNVALGPEILPTSIDASLDMARALHVKLVRVEVLWSALEPEQAGKQDKAYLAKVAQMLDGARTRGLRVVLVVEGTPCWATTAPDDLRAQCTGPTPDQRAFAYPPADAADFGRVVGFLAGRYEHDLAAIEVWNEPDHASEDYLKGDDKPHEYALLLKAAYPEAKRAAPDVPVLAGSLVGANGSFLRALYREGIKGNYDGLAVHYYDLVLASLRSIRAVQRAAGDDTPVWLTEFGWTSCSPARATEGGHACVTRSLQGADLADVFRGLRATPWVRAAVVYALQDSTGSHFGLVDARAHRKPAFSLLAGLLSRPIGPPRRVTLHLAHRGGRVRATGTGPAGDNYELDAYRGGRLRYKAILRLSRDNRYALTLPAALGASGLRVRVYQYWTKRSASGRI